MALHSKCLKILVFFPAQNNFAKQEHWTQKITLLKLVLRTETRTENIEYDLSAVGSSNPISWTLFYRCPDIQTRAVRGIVKHSYFVFALFIHSSITTTFLHTVFYLNHFDDLVGENEVLCMF
jgi:hypothetical protein